MQILGKPMQSEAIAAKTIPVGAEILPQQKKTKHLLIRLFKHYTQMWRCTNYSTAVAHGTFFPHENLITRETHKNMKSKFSLNRHSCPLQIPIHALVTVIKNTV